MEKEKEADWVEEEEAAEAKGEEEPEDKEVTDRVYTSTSTIISSRCLVCRCCRAFSCCS